MANNANRIKTTKASALAYYFCNMRLLDKLQSMVAQASKNEIQVAPKQTHEVAAKEMGSIDEVEELEIHSLLSLANHEKMC